jgi:hypothetical protein
MALDHNFISQIELGSQTMQPEICRGSCCLYFMIDVMGGLDELCIGPSLSSALLGSVVIGYVIYLTGVKGRV